MRSIRTLSVLFQSIPFILVAVRLQTPSNESVQSSLSLLAAQFCRPFIAQRFRRPSAVRHKVICLTVVTPWFCRPAVLTVTTRSCTVWSKRFLFVDTLTRTSNRTEIMFMCVPGVIVIMWAQS